MKIGDRVEYVAGPSKRVGKIGVIVALNDLPDGRVVARVQLNDIPDALLLVENLRLIEKEKPTLLWDIDFSGCVIVIFHTEEIL